MSSAQHVVKVRREVMVEMMTCPICNKLLQEATTISECLHTFCRKCIHKKLSDEELENCPVCDIDLGCSPLEKLRPDHNLQDIRAKIFPLRKKKENTPETSPSVTPVKIKERSLSSLVVDPPRVTSPQNSTITGERRKPSPRKAASLRGPTSLLDKSVESEEDSAEDLSKGSSSLETDNKIIPIVRQNFSNDESFTLPAPKQESDNGSKSFKAKVELWNPLNYLAEVANRSKLPKRSASQYSAAKSEPCETSNNKMLHIPEGDIKGNGTELEVQENKNGADISFPDGNKSKKKFKRIRRKKADYIIPPQVVLDSDSHRKVGPIWFKLVAFEDQTQDWNVSRNRKTFFQGLREVLETPKKTLLVLGYWMKGKKFHWEVGVQLPQISSSYLRIKDGTIPVCFIQKYLEKKLELTNEDEVELKCLGQSVIPTLQLNSLVELWLQSTATSQKMPAQIGSSAKDFVMVLAYARKGPSP